MEDILMNLIPQADTLLASAIATGLVFAVKGVLALIRRLTQKTETTLDDRIADDARAALKDKIRDI